MNYDAISTDSNSSEAPEVQRDECLSCKDLGQMTDSSLLLLTLSPDIQRDSYNEMSPDKQQIWLDNKIKLGMQKVSKMYYLDFISIHYEFTKAYNLHAHIIIGMDPSFQSYDIPCANISKIFHRLIGRLGNKSMISSKAEWVVEPETLYEYVNKQNVFEPKHLRRNDDNKKKSLIEWLIK